MLGTILLGEMFSTLIVLLLLTTVQQFSEMSGLLGSEVRLLLRLPLLWPLNRKAIHCEAVDHLSVQFRVS